jgi:undecaprenyl-diphosphatase
MLHRAMRARNAVTTGTSAAIAHGFGPVGMPLLAVASGAALALRRRDPAPLAVVVATGLGSLLMTIGGKDVVERHRPARHDAVAPFEHSPSFPSGHTLNATAVTGALAYLLMLEQRSVPAQIGTAVAAAATAGTVGMSRVLLGAHWFTDVLTGWAAGTGWLALVVTADRLRLTVDRRDAPRTPAAHEPAGTA